MEKLKYLIAEDEPLICESIRISVNTELGVELCGCASDGESALALIEQECPDIVLLDMNMPKLNGIQLLSRLAQQRVRPQVIVISGYDAFDYTHPSLIYGVVDYIRKPVNPQTLNEAIQKAIVRIQKDRHNKLQSDFWEDSVQRQRDTVMGALFSRIIQDPFGRGLSLAKSLEQEQEEPTESYFLLGIGPLKEEWKLRGQTLLEQTLKALDQQAVLLSELIPGKHFAVVFGGQQGKSNRLDFLTAVLQKLEARGCTGCHIAISNVHGTIQEAGLAFDETEAVLRAGELLHFTNVRTLDDFHANLRLRQRFEENHMELLKKALRNLSLPDCEEAVCYALLSTIDISEGTQYREQLANQIASLLTDFTREHNLTDQKITELVNNFVFSAMQHSSAFLLGQDIMRAFQAVLRVTRDSKYNKQLFYLIQTKAYIDENYGSDISLEDAARQVGLNPSYLSVMFKEYFGINFLDYVTSCRMLNAKKLLAETQNSVDEIALAVGYPNSKYFLRLFKKKNGMTPTQYRDSIEQRRE